MGFSRQEYWSGLPCPPPGDLPDPGIKPTSPAWQEDSLPLATREAQEKSKLIEITKMIELADKDFEMATINMFKELKKNTNVNKQIENVSRLVEPDRNS